MKINKFKCNLFVLFFLIISIIYGSTDISFFDNYNDEKRSSIFGTSLLFAQQGDYVDKNQGREGNSKSTEDSKNQETVLFMVMVIILILWIGISIYLFLLNRKVSSLEKKIDEL